MASRQLYWPIPLRRWPRTKLGMSISISCSTCGSSTSGADQDVQVKTLKSQIEDWSTCPTTDPQTKRAIVGRLQTELDSVTSSIQAKAKAEQEQPSEASSSTPGLGESIDLRV